MRFENGCGLPLLVMTVVGTLALIGVVVFGVFGSLIIALLHEYSNLQNVICKVSTNVSAECVSVHLQNNGCQNSGAQNSGAQNSGTQNSGQCINKLLVVKVQ
jgi:hypothetical protein